MSKAWCIALLGVGFGLAGAQTVREPGLTGAYAPAQAAADALRDFAKTDAAFLAARNINPTFDEANLASLMQYPTDPIVIVALRGSEVRAAFERSVALYPQPNPSFLQISGFSVEFNPTLAPESRVVTITTSAGPLDPNRTYTIAMPMSLGRGGMGYFKIWDRAKITRELTDTVESVLRGKRSVSSSPRWVVRS